MGPTTFRGLGALQTSSGTFVHSTGLSKREHSDRRTGEVSSKVHTSVKVQHFHFTLRKRSSLYTAS